MAKVDYRSLSSEDRKKLAMEIGSLFHTFNLSEDGQRFLLSMLKPSEIVMLGRRIRIARALLQGQTIATIARMLRVGENNIRDVDQWLSALFPDYRTVLPQYIRQSRTDGRIADPYSLQSLRKRYPAHFLLLNILLGDPFQKK